MVQVEIERIASHQCVPTGKAKYLDWHHKITSLSLSVFLYRAGTGADGVEWGENVNSLINSWWHCSLTHIYKEKKKQGSCTMHCFIILLKNMMLWGLISKDYSHL